MPYKGNFVLRKSVDFGSKKKKDKATCDWITPTCYRAVVTFKPIRVRDRLLKIKIA